MSKRIVICVNSHSPLLGGCEKVTQKIAEYLGDFYDVIVMTRRYPGRDHSSFTNYKVMDYLQNDANGFMKQLQAVHPDVVLIYSDLFDFFRQIINKPSTYKTILAPCGANYVFNNPSAANTVYRRSDNINSIICHSTHERDYKFYNIEKFSQKLTIIPNGIDLDEFDDNHLNREEIASELRINHSDISKKWVLSVSNFFPGKGREHLADILNQLPSEEFLYIQVCSKMSFPVGETLEIIWRRQMTQAGINFTLAKNISREYTVGLFKNSNVFIFPSEKEVAPLVLLECMAARLPWVSTDVGNAKDLSGGVCITAAKNSKYYNIIDVRVKKLLASAMEKIWHTPQQADGGRLQIEQSMQWNKLLPRYKEVIKQV